MGCTKWKSQSSRVTEIKLVHHLAEVLIPQQQKIGKHLTLAQAAELMAKVREFAEAVPWSPRVASCCIDILEGWLPARPFRIPDDTIHAVMLAGTAAPPPRGRGQVARVIVVVDPGNLLVGRKLNFAFECLQPNEGEPNWWVLVYRLAIEALPSCSLDTLGLAADVLNWRDSWIHRKVADPALVAGAPSERARSAVSTVFRRCSAPSAADGAPDAWRDAWRTLQLGSWMALSMVEGEVLLPEDVLPEMLATSGALMLMVMQKNRPREECMACDGMLPGLILSVVGSVVNVAGLGDLPTSAGIEAGFGTLSTFALCLEDLVRSCPDSVEITTWKPSVYRMLRVLVVWMTKVAAAAKDVRLARACRLMELSATISISKVCLARYGLCCSGGGDLVARMNALFSSVPKTDPAHECVAVLRDMVGDIVIDSDLADDPLPMACLKRGALAADGDGPLLPVRMWADDDDRDHDHELVLCGYPKCTNRDGPSELHGVPMRCGGCTGPEGRGCCLMHYCSEGCQQEDWKRPGGHKLACPLLPP